MLVKLKSGVWALHSVPILPVKLKSGVWPCPLGQLNCSLVSGPALWAHPAHWGVLSAQELAQTLWGEVVQDSRALALLTVGAVVHHPLMALQLQRRLCDVVLLLQQVASFRQHLITVSISF